MAGQPSNEPTGPFGTYGDPPAHLAQPGRPAYPGQPAHPDYGEPGWYPGQVPSYPGSQPLAPAGPGWNGTPPWDQFHGPPQQPPGYGAGYDAPVGPPPTRPGPQHTGRSSRKRGRATAAVAVAAVSVLAAAGGVTYHLLSSHSAGQTLATGSSHSPAPSQPSHSAAPPVTHHGDLRRYLIAAPSGSHPWPQPLGTNGKLSLAQAAALSTDSKSRRRRLTEDHYVQGAVRSWVTESGTWIDVRLYQFRSAADAQNMFLTDIDASSSNTPVADQFPVSKVPGARAFADAKPDSDGFISVIAIGVKGDVAFIVDVAEHAHKASLGMPDDLMRQQYSKL